MPTLVVGMLERRENYDAATTSVGMVRDLPQQRGVTTTVMRISVGTGE